MAYPMIEQRDTAPSEAELEALRERIAADGPRLPLAEPALDEDAARQAARKAVDQLVDKQMIDAMLEQV